MQAQLQARRIPVFPIVLFLALAVTLLLGGAIGYAIKTTAPISGPAHVVYVPEASQTGDLCEYSGGHKAC